MAAALTPTDYPARLEIDYPERLSRLTTLLRIIWVIPITIVLIGIGASQIILAPLLMIVFRMKYPRWWFDWNLEFSRFNMRVAAYVLLLTDQYPATDEEQSVHLDLDYPNVEQDLNRWLPLVKWLLAIPHYIVIVVLASVAFLVVLIAWFAILFTGRFPRSLFNFVVGVERWSLRIQAYTQLLITDRYPPFSLK